MTRAQYPARVLIAHGVFGGGLRDGERLRVELCERTATIDVRVWCASDAGAYPTDRGLSLPISSLPWFSDAIAGAFEFACRNGLLQRAYRELPT
jgi:hypothetical protein